LSCPEKVLGRSPFLHRTGKTGFFGIRDCPAGPQDEHYDSRKRSYTTVYIVSYDRIRPYFVVYLTPELRPYLVMSYTTKYDRRIQQYTVVYRRIRTSFSLVKKGQLSVTPSPHRFPPPLLPPPSVPAALSLPCLSSSIPKNTYR